MRTDNHPPGFVGQTPFEIVNILGTLTVDGAPPTTTFGCMNGSNQRDAPVMFEGNPNFSGKPVVNVNQIRSSAREKRMSCLLKMATGMIDKTGKVVGIERWN
jgi:hypothetical protein